MCIVSGDQIVEILYGRGNFGKKEIQMTYGVVAAYAVGFVFQAARSNLVKVYYAFQDSKTPMINGLLAIVLNITLSITLSKFIGVVGVALATSVSMLFVTALLLRGVKKYLSSFTIKKSCKELLKGAIAACITAVVAFALKSYLSTGLIVSFLIISSVVVGMYIVLLFLFKSDNAEWIGKSVYQKFKRG